MDVKFPSVKLINSVAKVSKEIPKNNIEKIGEEAIWLKKLKQREAQEGHSLDETIFLS